MGSKVWLVDILLTVEAAAPTRAVSLVLGSMLADGGPKGDGRPHSDTGLPAAAAAG